MVRPSGTTGYRIADFQDPAREVTRLERQASIIGEAEDAAYTALGFPEHGLGLDLACGPGFVARRILERRPELRLIGVDLDAGALARARAWGPVVRADARKLPFPGERFDLAMTRLLLRHVPNPEIVINELVRVVRKGGMVFAEDCDDGSLILDPYPRGFPDLLNARHGSLRRRGAEPLIGRRLPAMLRKAGLLSVEPRFVVVSSEDIGIRAFGELVLGPAAEAIDPDLLDSTSVADARKAIDEWCSLESAFGMTTLMVFRGYRA